MVFLAASALALTLATRLALVLVREIVLGFGFVLGAGNCAVIKLVAAFFPEASGTVGGLVGATGGLGGLPLPLAQGYAQDLTGVCFFGFLLLAALALVSLALNLLVVART